MGVRMRLSPVGLSCLCVGAVVGVIVLVLLATVPDEAAARRPLPITIALGDPTTRPIFDVQGPIEDGGFAVAAGFTPPIHEPTSLREMREALGVRGRLGLAVLEAEFDQVRLPFRAPKEQVTAAGRILHGVGLLHLYEGRCSEAAACFQKAMELGRPVDIPMHDRARRMALLGILAMRRAAADDPREKSDSSCDLFPIAPTVSLSRQAAARDASKRFKDYLGEWPGDLRIRWLLNLACMELGEYPGQVPSEFLVPLDVFRSELDVGRFEDVAARAGLTARGRNLAGGSIFDDFNGDGLPDLFTASRDVTRGASLFLNRGDGSFEDHSARAGLADQVYSSNVVGADFDNDGDLDVLLLRGGGEAPLRPSLLKNRGDGTFDDVTIASGLAEPTATRSAAWGDYDNDGWLDLFVCGEEVSSAGDGADSSPGPRNRCRLYHSRRDGTFADVAEAAGIVGERSAVGSAWGDYDDDGRLDLYVSDREGPGRLYHNEGDGTFRERAAELGVTGPGTGSSCWFWDYDNDGRLDLLVQNTQASLTDIVASALGRTVGEAGHPRVYRNLGTDGFRDMTAEVGLDRPMAALGCQFGDVDNDGFLDIYVGSGWRSCSGLVPNRMFKNVEGRQFGDVTISSGTGSLQKGNSVSFADFDDDGDLDLFVQSGGFVPGDPSDNHLFRNPGHGRHWLKVKLVGNRTNRSALGAKIRVDLASSGGRMRSIYRTVGSKSSSGGNGLIELIGLHDATRVAALTIRWPTSRTTQTFHDLATDQAIEIVEGVDSYRGIGRRPVQPARGRGFGSPSRSR
jgi:hypothetical protein